MITLDLETFRQGRESANVTGVIFLELQDKAFPQVGWSDFPVIILGWWIEAWLQFMTPERREAVWRFMDGPHYVTLIKEGNARSTGAFEFREVQSNLLEAAVRVIAHCQRHNMLSRDLETLCENMQILRAHQGTQRTEANFFPLLKLRPSARHK
jgi:hypothetical protein